ERIPRVGHWFDPWASAALSGAMTYLSTIDDPVWHDRVAVAISSAIVRISRQESDTRYAAVDKRGDRLRSATELAQSVVRVCEWLSSNATAGPPAVVYNGDARDMCQLADGSVAACVFSPPYPNAYEYWLYHKYRMYWLGFDPIFVRANELGARPHYCKPNGLDEHDFAGQMRDVFRELARTLRAGAPVVIIVSDS